MYVGVVPGDVALTGVEAFRVRLFVAVGSSIGIVQLNPSRYSEVVVTFIDSKTNAGQSQSTLTTYIVDREALYTVIPGISSQLKPDSVSGERVVELFVDVGRVSRVGTAIVRVLNKCRWDHSLVHAGI